MAITMTNISRIIVVISIIVLMLINVDNTAMSGNDYWQYNEYNTYYIGNNHKYIVTTEA